MTSDIYPPFNLFSSIIISLISIFIDSLINDFILVFKLFCDALDHLVHKLIKSDDWYSDPKSRIARLAPRFISSSFE